MVFLDQFYARPFSMNDGGVDDSSARRKETGFSSHFELGLRVFTGLKPD
jgi:hypothetical protein